jgi:hypothetical protein
MVGLGMGMMGMGMGVGIGMITPGLTPGLGAGIESTEQDGEVAFPVTYPGMDMGYTGIEPPIMCVDH